MPGIAGIIRKGSQDESKPALSLMVKCIMHELFYVSDTYINEELGLHRRWEKLFQSKLAIR
jgi:hypothetical protein